MSFPINPVSTTAAQPAFGTQKSKAPKRVSFGTLADGVRFGNTAKQESKQADNKLGFIDTIWHGIKSFFRWIDRAISKPETIENAGTAGEYAEYKGTFYYESDIKDRLKAHGEALGDKAPQDGDLTTMAKKIITSMALSKNDAKTFEHQTGLNEAKFKHLFLEDGVPKEAGPLQPIFDKLLGKAAQQEVPPKEGNLPPKAKDPAAQAQSETEQDHETNIEAPSQQQEAKEGDLLLKESDPTDKAKTGTAQEDDIEEGEFVEPQTQAVPDLASTSSQSETSNTPSNTLIIDNPQGKPYVITSDSMEAALHNHLTEEWKKQHPEFTAQLSKEFMTEMLGVLSHDETKAHISLSATTFNNPKTHIVLKLLSGSEMSADEKKWLPSSEIAESLAESYLAGYSQNPEQMKAQITKIANKFIF